MLLDIIKRRYSAREFDDTKVDKNKIDYIIECALHAPSKQAIYPYEIHVLSDSPKAKQLKDYLVWNDTWCVGNHRAREQDKNSDKKVYNLQYGAPLLLVWTTRCLDNHPASEHDYFKKVSKKVFQMQYENDIFISASYAMLGAEEQNLQTCFGRCHDSNGLAEMLGRPGYKGHIALAIGYATELKSSEDFYYRWVERDGIVDGWTIRNIPQHFPKEDHGNRIKSPSKEELVNYI